jgi:hypothetical protein
MFWRRLSRQPTRWRLQASELRPKNGLLNIAKPQPSNPGNRMSTNLSDYVVVPQRPTSKQEREAILQSLPRPLPLKERKKRLAKRLAKK